MPPTAAGAGSVLGKCRVFPSDNPWNQDISGAPVDPKSDRYLAAMNASNKRLHPDFGTVWNGAPNGIPYVVVAGTQGKVPVTFGPRRAGDAIALYADPSRAKQLLGWEAKHKVPEAIIRSAWYWFSKHPRGYGS